MFTLLVLGCTTCSCSFTASSIALSCWTHLFAISSISSTSDVSSVQYLHRIFASSPTLTERVIIHNEMNDTTNNTAGIPKKNKKLFHVVSKSKRASTFEASTCKWPRNERENETLLQILRDILWQNVRRDILQRFMTSFEQSFQYLCKLRCVCNLHEKLINSRFKCKAFAFLTLL